MASETASISVVVTTIGNGKFLNDYYNAVSRVGTPPPELNWYLKGAA